jgi:hypothetical protein
MAARCDIAHSLGPALFRSFTGAGPEMKALWYNLHTYAPRMYPPDNPPALNKSLLTFSPTLANPSRPPTAFMRNPITLIVVTNLLLRCTGLALSPLHAVQVSGAFFDTLPTPPHLTLSETAASGHARSPELLLPTAVLIEYVSVLLAIAS